MIDIILRWVMGPTIAISLMSVLTACDNRSSTLTSQSNPENIIALPFVAPVSATQPIMRIEGAWEDPQKITTELFDVGQTSFTDGPDLMLGPENKLIASWHVYRDLDSQKNTYQNNKSQLSQLSLISNTWSGLPAVPTQFRPANVSTVFRMNKYNGDVYALWIVDGMVRYSQLNNAKQWQTPVTIGSAQWADIVFRDRVTALVYASNRLDNGVSELKASIVSPENGPSTSNILKRGTGSTQIKRITASLRPNKGALFVWQEINNQTVSLWSAEYSLSRDWFNIQQISSISGVQSSNLQGIKLVQNSMNEDLELIISEQTNGVWTVSALTYTGAWGVLNALLTSKTDNLNAKEKIDIASNSQGEIAIVWREEFLIKQRNYAQLKSRYFTAASGWGPVEPISQAIPAPSAPLNADLMATPTIQLIDPSIVLNDTGKMSVAWIENGQGRSNLLVNHHRDAFTSWGTQELVASYDKTRSTIQSLSIALGEDGRPTIAWQTGVDKFITKERVYWSSRSTGEGKLIEIPLQVLTTSRSVDIIRPSALWQAPVDIWNATIFSNTVSLIHGPHIQVSDIGSGFLSLYKNTDFDPMSGGYLTKENILLSSTTPGTWNAEQPFSNATKVDSSEIKIKMTADGDAYALWLVEGALIFNHYTNGVGWATEMNLGTSDTLQSIMIDAAGSAWLFWLSGDDINLQQFIPGTGANSGLQTVVITTNSNTWFYATPVIDAAGVINIAWIQLSPFGSGAFSTNTNLYLLTYSPGVGFGFVEKAPQVGSLNAMDRVLTLVASANDEVIAVSQDSHGSIFAITYSPTNLWGRWENLDYNLDKSDSIMGDAKVASNGDNNVMVVWSEQTTTMDGNQIYRIYSNKYDSIGDGNGVHWPIPERVGAIVPQQNGAGELLEQFQTRPLIAMLADGRAIATWLDSSEVNSSLYANQYTPGTGWAATPDQVVAYDRLATGMVKSPDVKVSSDGSVLLSWRQEIATEFANEIHVWVAKGQF